MPTSHFLEKQAIFSSVSSQSREKLPFAFVSEEEVLCEKVVQLKPSCKSASPGMEEWNYFLVVFAGLLCFNRLDPVSNSDCPEDVRRWPSM